MVERNFENCPYKTPQIGINLSFHSFTIIEEYFDATGQNLILAG